jgi:hypothetical protein
MSRFDLNLIPTHPDHAAGLAFVGYSVRAFSIVALAAATIVAGRFANLVLYHGGPGLADIIAATVFLVEVADFSATTDLNSIVGNVYQMRFVPLDLNSLVLLIAAMLLPFVPVLLMTVPAGTILNALKKLLF